MTPPVTLPTRSLGKNGPQVPRLGLGLMGISVAYGKPAPDDQRLALLDKAYEMGETFWDTSDLYGDSEELIGRWLAANPSKRNDIFLASKFGYKVNPGGRIVEHTYDSSPEYCRTCIDKSLTRLGVSVIDLYYIHILDGKTPVEQTMRALVELKHAGKIRHIGLSNCSAATLRRAHAVHPVAAVQTEYNAFSLDIESPENKLLETARELGIALVAYSPLGRGLLTGAIRSTADIAKEGDMRGMIPRMSEDNIDKNVALVDKMREVAASKGATAAQLALAWLLAQGDDIFGIPGTTKVERLAENLGCFDVKLSVEEEGSIRRLADDVQGLRLPEHYLGHLYADTPLE